jgi:phenylalanyl-tRNA synthetase beta chain
MLISYNWLKSYVKDLPSPEKLADIFSFHICELESFEKIENGDYIFDIKILPDRAHDLLCHRGVARDLASVLGLSYNDINYELSEGNDTNLEIKIEQNTCRRYIGRIVRNVKVTESPKWIKEHLEAMGQRSINSLVDATNIVMFDRGNPIHVFDLDKLESEKIIIDNAKNGEEITLLDGKVIKLDESILTIRDEKGCLAIAGVKGGKKAEVDLNTKNILIEVANFDPTSIRKTAKKINIYTDAVKRFENDLSSSVAPLAMNDMTALIMEMNKEAKIEKIVDIYPQKEEQRVVNFNIEKISKILGFEIKKEEVKDILNKCDFIFKDDGDDFSVTIPLTRLDLQIEEDIAEEIGRIYGYDKIVSKLPEINLPAQAGFENKDDIVWGKINWAKSKLVNDGYKEVMTYAFSNKGEVEVLASASDKKFLRTNLVDGLKESIKLNKINLPLLDIDKLKVFEIGTVFLKDKEVVNVAYGDEKNIVEISLEEFCKKEFSSDAFVQVLGRGGREPVPDHSQKHTDSNSLNSNKFFKPWSVYPFITRDIAVWVPKEIQKEELVKIYKEFGTELLVKEPKLFDEFTKPASSAGEGEKTSYGFRLVFQSYERTLTDEEINLIMSHIEEKVSSLGWTVR